MRLLILNRALKEYGIKEIPGDKSEPEINKYFDIINQEWADDEIAWCGAFINWVCKIEGFEYTNKLDARSWLGLENKISDPKPGHIVIFWREDPNSWKGHVGIFIAKRNGYIYCLGGNQSNKVQISAYPEDRVLGYREPKFIGYES